MPTAQASASVHTPTLVPSLAPTKKGGKDAVKIVAGAAILGGAGWAVYKYWYLPRQMKKEILAYSQSQGLPPGDAMARLGKVGCQAFGAKYGMPPDATGDVCGEMAQAASELARQMPELLGGTLSAAGGGIGAVGAGLAQGGLAVAVMPIQAASYAVGQVGKGLGATYQGTKRVVSDVYTGAKTIVSDVAIKPIASVVKGGASVVGKIGGTIGGAFKSLW